VIFVIGSKLSPASQISILSDSIWDNWRNLLKLCHSDIANLQHIHKPCVQTDVNTKPTFQKERPLTKTIHLHLEWMFMSLRHLIQFNYQLINLILHSSPPSQVMETD